MDMIEKVARAVCIEGGFDPEMTMPNDGPLWKYYIPGAKAAIEAMREPNHDMTASIVPVGEDRTDAVTVWQAMIDAALK